jgi:NAD(P)H-hydrate epimerase
MKKKIRKKDIAKFRPIRKHDSHKGQNGQVLIIGGSQDYHGAPVLAGLAAMKAGADKVHLYVPQINFDVTRSLSPELIVRSYPGRFLTVDDVEPILELGRKCDCVLIGPGIGKDPRTLNAVKEIVLNLKIATVLDAEATIVLKEIDKYPLEQSVLITPHPRELANLVDREVNIQEEDPKAMILLRSLAMDLQINILLKGFNDFVVSDEGIIEINETGHSGMTSGGSGDVLAGICASLIAQKVEPYKAAQLAAFYFGKTGENLAKKKGYGYTALDLVDKFAETFFK